MRPQDLPYGGCPKCLKAHQNWNAFVEEVDDVAPLALPGSCTIFPFEGDVEGDQSGARPPEVAVATPEPSVPVPKLSVSEAAFGQVSGALLGRIGRGPRPDIDMGGDRPFRTQIRLSKQLRAVCVLGTLPEPPSDSQDSRSLIGLTAEEMSLHQLGDSDFSLLLDWFGGEIDPQEGDLFLSNQAVKHYWINRQFFTLDDRKVLWKTREADDGSQSKLLVIPAGLRTEVLRLCHDVPDARPREHVEPSDRPPPLRDPVPSRTPSPVVPVPEAWLPDGARGACLPWRTWTGRSGAEEQPEGHPTGHTLEWAGVLEYPPEPGALRRLWVYVAAEC